MERTKTVLLAALAMTLAAAVSAQTVAEVRTATAGAFAVECAKPEGWRFSLKSEKKGSGLEEVRLTAETDVASVPPPFVVRFSIPKGRLQHVWHPFDQHFPCCWTEQSSSFSVGLPLRVNYDDDETNVLTVAVSDALNAIRFRTDVDMRNNNAHVMEFAASFFNDPNPPRTRYETVFRLDSRAVFWSQAAEEGVKWISATAGRPPAVPPPPAYEPLYSSWYVFRHTVTQAAMDDELERAAALGMKTVILDDGWQADRGDWNVNTNRFPDLKAHVARTHELGMKYLLWFALPHLRTNSPAFARFKDMRISEKPDYWGDYIFDPRHPEVRAHLTKRLVELARDYDLDGFKLDFIDQFVAQGDDDLAAKNGFAGCDYRSVPEATERFLRDISTALRAVKPDMLIEFRQGYVGPVVRQYGNMLRANDCPGDYEANRCRTLALRVTSPGSAVHSDMLMWRNDDSAAEVMRQIWNVAFSVIQYSAFLKDLPEAHLKVIRKSIGFMNEHRRTLLFGKLTPHRPDLGYPCVEAESESERIIIVYAPEYVVRIPEDGKQTILVNATRANSLVVEWGGVFSRLSVCPSDYLTFEAKSADIAGLTLVEAEAFANRGGWSVDQQFMAQMGSPYLLAHGLGKPVDDAKTRVALPAAGKYRLWVRTRDWVVPHGAGQFQVLIDGKAAGTFGKGGSGAWEWWNGGIVEATSPSVEVALHDLTGFEGRVDALCFSRDLEGAAPPNGSDFAWRRWALGLPEPIPSAGTYDFCVVGGGFAGMCAAVSAAREGLKVAIVQDRPVFGGNGSEECRVVPQGKWGDGPFPKNRKIMEEIRALIPKHQGPAWEDNYKPDSAAWDRWLRAEKNLTVLSSQRATAAEVSGGRIRRISIRNIYTGEERSVAAKFFADCTGDAALAEAAGAKTMWQPRYGLKGGLGSSTWWAASNRSEKVSFPALPWACKVEKELDALTPGELKFDVVDGGSWSWETGFYRDPVKDGEDIRDTMLRGIWGWWDFAKNRSPRKANYERMEIYQMGYILGKRDAHRIVGDYVLTEEDLVQHRVYPDGVVDTTWFIDLHTPYGEFRTNGCEDAVEIKSYPIPYRCFYSRDLANLFMAGKDISGTYRALASFRVQNTTAQMGSMVGKAVSLCVKNGWTPRALGRDHFADLKASLER